MKGPKSNEDQSKDPLASVSESTHLRVVVRAAGLARHPSFFNPDITDLIRSFKGVLLLEVRPRESRSKPLYTILRGGSLGSWIDEERSQLRELV
jgi:hypothetical protein